MPFNSIYDSIKINYYIAKCFLSIFITMDYSKAPVRIQTTALDCSLHIFCIIYYAYVAYSTSTEMINNNVSSLILNVAIFVSTVFGTYVVILYPVSNFIFRNNLANIFKNLHFVDLIVDIKFKIIYQDIKNLIKF